MFDLKQIKATKDTTLPPRTVVHGQAKLGKSTFASKAPSPIFIDTEDGLRAIDTKSFPLCTTWDDVLSSVSTLYQEDHQFKTVVLDSADWAQGLAYARVCSDNNVKNIEACGYGKGYTYAADLFRELLDGLTALRNHKGMGVVILAHSEIRRYDDPTTDAYDQIQIALSKQIGKMVCEWADVIGLAQIDTIAKIEKKKGFTEERTRAITTGSRVLRLVGAPSYLAGNRYGLPDTIPLDWNNYQLVLDEARK
jgi:hypothetical protein